MPEGKRLIYSLPWRISDSNDHGDIYISPVDDYEHIVIVKQRMLESKLETIETAEYVVKSVNSYDHSRFLLEQVLKQNISSLNGMFCLNDEFGDYGCATCDSSWNSLSSSRKSQVKKWKHEDNCSLLALSIFVGFVPEEEEL